jgi:hypothetical protein
MRQLRRRSRYKSRDLNELGVSRNAKRGMKRRSRVSLFQGSGFARRKAELRQLPAISASFTRVVKNH